MADYLRAHRKERARVDRIVQSGNGWCTEPICLHRTRWIQPGTPWHLAHNRQTGEWRGPAHARCNTSEGATHGNRHRHKTALRPNTWASRNW